MANEPYRVEYHVVGVIYLEPGRELLGPDFARLWSSTSIFGTQRATAGFWHADTCSEEVRTELGSLEHVRRLLDRDDRAIFGGGTSANPNAARGSPPDCDFYYAHGDSSRCFGYETLPHLLYAVSGQWFERVGAEVVLENIKEHFDVADRYAPPYGLIDVSAADDCYGGIAYTPIFFGNCHLHRRIEHEKWLYACSKRRDQARSVYWGNYFGPAILDRLGGRDQFLTRFRQQARHNGIADALVWEFPNGVFVSLCLEPLGCKPGPPLDGSAGANARWLVQDLGTHGVLDPWGK